MVCSLCHYSPPLHSLNSSYFSPDLLLHLHDQECVRGRCPHFHLLDNHHQLQWERADRCPWRSSSWIQDQPHTTVRYKIDGGRASVNCPYRVSSYLLCHIAIGKCKWLTSHLACFNGPGVAPAFGRQNNYKIDPDQELIAVGMTNLLGVFFSSYPTTASFSATALKPDVTFRLPCPASSPLR
jgi:hypothetical protein